MKRLKNPFYNRDIVSIKDFQRPDLDYLFHVANEIKTSLPNDSLKNKSIGLMFLEPSTRTRLSFESAMNSLGGKSISFGNLSDSSTQKGENLSDSLLTMDQYVDAIILRHASEGVSRYASEICKNPIINAGSGSEEHPTQAMLDVYTILNECGKVDNLNIAIFGDLKYGRTVYSLLYALSNYKPNIYLVSPKPLQLRSDPLIELKNTLNISVHENLQDIISDLDVIYTTRIQKERFPDLQEYERVKGSYKIDNNLLTNAKENLVLLHPMPRSDEIPGEIDNTPYAKYFNQVSAGKLIRSTLLHLIFTENPSF
tara:strand:+ start:14352 stop:15287 length:936 start_codon:yes stop_codon:yes gene_type:complete